MQNYWLFYAMHQRADLQPTKPLWEIYPAPARPLPCLRRLQEGFNSIWHAALWATMKKYNISANHIRVIKKNYDKATSAVPFNSSIGDWFRTTVRVWQVCLLSPILFNIFLEIIMTDALEDQKGTVSIGGWIRTTVGVRQWCLLSPILFNIFLERIMTDTSEDHKGIGGRTITTLLMTSMA